jgi:uncharacterized membrane protein YfcA
VDVAHLALIALAALVAGAVNAIAGGGSLLTFPTLVAFGLPPLVANITNTVALCPGYVGATFAQRRELVGQGGRIVRLLPFALAGSVVGAWILLHTSEKSFQIVVPVLLVFAAGLLAAQSKLRAFLRGRSGVAHSVAFGLIPIGLAAIYGAYFGAGLGVIILATLAVTVDDTLLRMNALKQLLSLVINLYAAIVYIIDGRIDWTVAGAVAVGSLVGGVVGGKLASRIPEAWLRWSAITIALAVSAVYFARL